MNVRLKRFFTTKLAGVLTGWLWLPVIALIMAPVSVSAEDDWSSGTVVSIVISPEIGYHNDFTASVYIDNVSNFNVADYAISYDPALLRLDNVSSGFIQNIPVPVFYNPLENGVLKVVNDMNRPDGGLSGSGTLALLRFHVMGEPGNTPWIEPENGTLAASTAVQIPAVWKGAASLIVKGQQSIAFDPLEDKGFYAPDFNLAATASSGLAITFSASDNCTLNGGLVHLTGVGLCNITASQPGDSFFNPAPAVSHSFIVRDAGDANGDARINAVDISRTARVIAKLDSSLDLADANGDSLIDNQDINQIVDTIINRY
jgi:hypothetical protein